MATRCRTRGSGQGREGQYRYPVKFWPDPVFFDSPKFSVRELRHLLRAKAVLCPGLLIRFFFAKARRTRREWCYQDGLRDYLVDALARGSPSLPEEPFVGSSSGNDEVADWALVWLPRWGGGHRELRQSDPNTPGRHPRQRSAQRADRGGTRVLRVPEPVAARRQAGA